ncbi:hypothetical protein ACFL2Q_20240, partial [Thermodesulfobacteriota bacterium]
MTQALDDERNTYSVYNLVDYDEVEHLLETDEAVSHEVDPDLTMTWTTEEGVTNRRFERIPPLYLTGTRDKRSVDQQYVWQKAILDPAELKGKESYEGRPHSWLRTNLGNVDRAPSAVGFDGTRRMKTLSGPLTFVDKLDAAKEVDWTLSVDVPKKSASRQASASPLRMGMRYSRYSKGRNQVHELTMDFVSARVTATSPSARLYDKRLTDPSSVPPDKRFDRHLKPYRMVFQNDGTGESALVLEGRIKEIDKDRHVLKPVATIDEDYEDLWLEVRPANNPTETRRILEIDRKKNTFRFSKDEPPWSKQVKEGLSFRVLTKKGIDPPRAAETRSLIATYTPTGLCFSCGRDMVTGYLPASRALIDPVSATGANLTARQILNRPIVDGDAKGQVNEKSSPPELILVSGAPQHTIPLASYAGLWIEVAPKTVQGGQSQLLRIREIREVKGRQGDPKTAKVSFLTSWAPEAEAEYTYAIGTTRLALSRDPGHGLIPIEFHDFKLSFHNKPEAPWVTLSYDLDSIFATETSSVMALLPWSEWGPYPDEWLKTGRVRLHHRNLVLEHPEFQTSFEDRFPPEGPVNSGDSNGESRSPILPFDDFINAVRDRYTEASGNLKANELTGTDQKETQSLTNWLPGAKILSHIAETDPLTSMLTYEEPEGDPRPKIRLDWN